MDRLEAMSVFVHAADAGSLSAAGRRLGLPLATVSRKISDLEAHLGARLLVRSSRGLSLSDAGRAYLPAARAILAEVHEAERVAAGEYSAPTGELTVAAPIVLGRLHVLPVIADFLAAYPDVDLRLALSDRAVHLVEERVDVAIRLGELPDSQLTASRIGSVRQVVCASPAYFAAHGGPGTPNELSRHPCITFEGLLAPDAWRFGRGSAASEIRVHSRLVVSTAEAAIDAAIAGIGLTRVLSYQVAEPLRRGALALTLEAFEPEPWPAHLVYNGHARLPLKLRAFLDFAAPRLRQRLTDAAL
jgi:DNA-binding transcriptional LysR family regulator